MDEATLLRFAGVFVPELKPLVPDILAATATLEKAKEIIAPLASAGDVGIFSLIPVIGQLEPMKPDLEKAFGTFQKVDAILVAYQTRLAAAAKL